MNSFELKFANFISSIETGELLIKLSLVNDFERFKYILQSDTSYRYIIDEIKISRLKKINEVKNRIRTIINLKNDVTKLHKYDVAIASYLLLILELSIDEAHEGYKIIESKNFPNLWWANFVLADIKTKLPKTENVTTSSFNFTTGMISSFSLAADTTTNSTTSIPMSITKTSYTI